MDKKKDNNNNPDKGTEEVERNRLLHFLFFFFFSISEMFWYITLFIEVSLIRVFVFFLFSFQRQRWIGSTKRCQKPINDQLMIFLPNVIKRERTVILYTKTKEDRADSKKKKEGIQKKGIMLYS